MSGPLLLRAAAAALVLSPAPAALAAQAGAAFPKGSYAALDRLPDWGGVWTVEATPGARAEQPVLKGKHLEAYTAWAARAREGVVLVAGSQCLPPGMPRMMTVGQYPIEFLFTPGRVSMHFEAWMQWRAIYTDGRGHPADLEPTFMGHSIGRWEGDTLVVDTVGVSAATPLVTGMTHSDKLHVIERMRLDPADGDALLVETTVEDPEALEKPWKTTLRMKRDRDGELLEFICAENDRNPVDAQGRVQFH
jgi:hypothetical protein